MIEIVESQVVTDIYSVQQTRAVTIIITNSGLSYLWGVGGLPIEGDLQPILNAREPELWAAAQTGGRAVDLYELTLKRVLKAFVLVVMDEINILRQGAGLSLRTSAQIDDAIKAKLKLGA